jgi:phage shock protein PspC (stress-responsive transcriptional regulator)
MATAAATLCLVVLAACGGADATAQFKSGYAAARGPLNRTFNAVVKTLSAARGKSAAQIAGTVGALADRFGSEVDSIRALKPPASVATAFATLRASLDRVEGDLRRISLAAKGKDLAGAELALENLGSDSRSASEAGAVVKQKLYPS